MPDEGQRWGWTDVSAGTSPGTSVLRAPPLLKVVGKGHGVRMRDSAGQPLFSISYPDPLLQGLGMDPACAAASPMAAAGAKRLPRVWRGGCKIACERDGMGMVMVTATAQDVPSLCPRRGDRSSILKSFLLPSQSGRCCPSFRWLLFFPSVTCGFGTMHSNTASSSAGFCGRLRAGL